MTAPSDDQADKTYETAKRLAGNPDPERRARLAARTDVALEILYFLAGDEAAEVRAGVAANPVTPHRADLLLAQDEAEAVRHTLVRKIVGAIPANGTADAPPLDRLVVEVLMALAADPTAVIRQALAEAVHRLDHAPQAVIRCLAQDRVPPVAEPVLRHSPQLGDEDLVATIEAAGWPGARRAVARRRQVSGRVAEAIVRSGDSEAVAALLGNHGAQIREDTLDHILDRAPAQESWHRPLVDRPGLPGGAVARLSRFVALSLVEALQRRGDLDPAVAEAVREVAAVRRAHDGAAMDAAAKPTRPDGAARARARAAAGTLDAEAIDDAVLAGDRPFVVAGLAALAGIDEAVADRILKTASAKGAVALAWHAGLGMRLAVKLQHHVAHVPGRAILHARDGADYPLTEEEMRWQLDFFNAAD